MKKKSSDSPLALTVRDATREDLTIIREMHHVLCRNEFENGFDLDIDLQWSYSDQCTEWLVDKISSENGIVLIAELCGRVVAYLVGSASDGQGGLTCHIESTFVLSSYRRNGVGTALITRFLDWAKLKKIQRVTVAAAPLNEPAVALYKRAGFKERTLVLELRDPV